MFSALAAVCTVDCAIEIVLITLHYITSVNVTGHNSDTTITLLPVAYQRYQ